MVPPGMCGEGLFSEPSPKASSVDKATKKQRKALVKKAAKKVSFKAAEKNQKKADLAGNHAEVDRVWQPDGSRHTLDGRLKDRDVSKGTVTLPAQGNRPALRVAYFFSGVERKASIAEFLKSLCEKEGYGVELFKIDTSVGGEAHDLMSSEVQDGWIDRIERGEFDVLIHSPPCGSWSRSNWANDSGPQPCRDRQHPWGLPGQKPAQQRRAEKGNVFVKFTIRALKASHEARARGFQIASLLEHPEDLGRTHRGEPASIWQLREIRLALSLGRFCSVTGHQPVPVPGRRSKEVHKALQRYRRHGRL